MAIIYFGVNVLVPLILSAVLAFIALIVVQISRFVKKKMGASYSKVVTLTHIASDKNEQVSESNKRECTAAPIEKETSSTAGNVFVRKRRPSIIPETSASPEPIPLVSSEGSFTSTDGILPPASRPTTALSRIKRATSSNRITPEPSITDDRPKTPVKTGAWTEKVSDETKGRKINRIKRKNSDRIISPSQCVMDGLADDPDGNKDRRNSSIFSDDMNVYEIW